MDNGLLWASIVSAVGLAAMGAIAIVVEPPLVSFDVLPNKIGATVAVEGDVASVDSRPEGWSRMRLQESNASLDVISDVPLNVSAGDRIRITGQVGTYAGRIQIEVEAAEDVVVLRPWRDHHVPLSRLLTEPATFVGTNVRTSGVAKDRILTSDHGHFGVTLRGPGNHRGPGMADGLFDFEPKLGHYFLQVERFEAITGPT